MKRILTIALFLASISAFCQTNAHFGIRLGGSSSYYSGADFTSYNTERKWSPTGGFYINSRISDYFWIKTDFNFVNKGLIFQAGDKKLKKNYYYADIYPICPAFHLKGFQLFAGPALSVLVTGSEQKLDSTGRVRSYADNELEGFNRLDVGVVAGFEYEAPFGLNAGIRYVKGFSSIREPNFALPRHEQFNDVFLITLGYTIGRKKDD